MTRDEVEALITSQGVFGAGRVLFDLVPLAEKPAWAARVLRAAMAGIPQVPASVARVERLASGPRWGWVGCHGAFSAVRVDTMRLDGKMYGGVWLPLPEQAVLHVVELAELVAKVAYNSTEPVDEFDEDSGWSILAFALHTITDANDPAFEREVWSALLRS